MRIVVQRGRRCQTWRRPRFRRGLSLLRRSRTSCSSVLLSGAASPRRPMRKLTMETTLSEKKNRTRCRCSPILAKTWSLNRNAFGMSGSFGSTHPVHSQRDGTRRRRRSTHCSSWVGSSLRRPFVCSATCLAFGRSSRAGFSGPRLLVSVPICVSSHALKPRRAMHTCLCECGA